MRIEHVALYVSDLEAAKDFFVTFLGASTGALYHNTKTDFRSYFICFDGGARLELMNKPELDNPVKSPNRTGYAHVAFNVGNKERVDELTEQLRNAGYEVLSGPRVTGDGYYESSIVAVEGNLIELTV
ncbi:MAG: VOC family protein [Oscillospiraceae bacterium]|nr:VOC family protein [Oscillospiraceae bacterium]